jgi:hypothetical protein
MRAYRFKREAFKILGVFVLIWVGAFIAMAAFNWIGGKGTSLAQIALGLACLSLLLLAALLFLIWFGIRAVEKRWDRGNSN